MRPALGVRNLVSRLKQVVLPAPLGPISAWMWPRLTRKGLRDVEALLKELALTRRRGYSVDDEAVREGVCSFGAPVFDSTGAAIAGIAVCINKALLGADRGARYRRLALDVAHALSERLGSDLARPAPTAGQRAGKRKVTG